MRSQALLTLVLSLLSAPSTRAFPQARRKPAARPAAPAPSGVPPIPNPCDASSTKGRIVPVDSKKARKAGGVVLGRTGGAKKRGGAGPSDQDWAARAQELLSSNYLALNSETFAKDAVKLVCFDPPVLTIDDFLPAEACAALREEAANGYEVPSQTLHASTAGHRTSTSWFLHFRSCAALLRRAVALLSEVSVRQMEEPQLVRYEFGQRFGWHGDALPPQKLRADGSDGGQRVATLLVYLNDVEKGGSTVFRDLGPGGGSLRVKPEQGKALLFFPANREGVPDDRTEHQAEPALDEKWIAQVWVHRGQYPPGLPQGNCNDPDVVFGDGEDGA